MPFLREMLYEAAFWRPGRPRPPLAEALAVPELTHHLSAWGRAGDRALIAASLDGQPLGAAWYRLFPADAPAYGFIDAATPELAIGVRPGCRGRGVGGALIAGLLARARRDGFHTLSLSVEPDNPARRLYQRHGFVVVSTTGGAWTMRADLS